MEFRNCSPHSSRQTSSDRRGPWHSPQSFTTKTATPPHLSQMAIHSPSSPSHYAKLSFSPPPLAVSRISGLQSAPIKENHLPSPAFVFPSLQRTTTAPITSVDSPSPISLCSDLSESPTASLFDNDDIHKDALDSLTLPPKYGSFTGRSGHIILCNPRQLFFFFTFLMKSQDLQMRGDRLKGT